MERDIFVELNEKCVCLFDRTIENFDYWEGDDA